MAEIDATRHPGGRMTYAPACRSRVGRRTRFPRSAARGRRHPVPALSVPAFPGRYGRIARNGSISAPNGPERRVCCGFCSGAEPKANHHGKKHQGYPHRAESAESLCGREPGTEPLHVLLRARPRKRDTSRWPRFFWRRPTRRRNTPSASSSFWRAATSKLRRLTPPDPSEPRRRICWPRPTASVRVGRSVPRFCRIAEEEGFPEVATAFRMISTVEAHHEERYLKLLSRFSDGDFFRRDGKIWWQCRNCGYVCEASQAPGFALPASIRRPISSRRKRTISVFSARRMPARNPTGFCAVLFIWACSGMQWA